MIKPKRRASLGVRGLHLLLTFAGGAALAGGVFLLLPVIQAMSETERPDTLIRDTDVEAQVDEPDAEKEEEQKEPEKEEEKPPELEPESADTETMDLSLDLNPGGGGGGGVGSLGMKLNSLAQKAGSGADIFTMADLDTKARKIYHAAPIPTDQTRKRAPGAVIVLFMVDPRGRVINPIVKKSSHPVFEKPALDAVKKWKFEAKKRGGKAVLSRMSVRINFPKR